MNFMNKIFLKSICRYLALISSFLILNSCSLMNIFNSDEVVVLPSQSNEYLKGQALVLNGEYEKSLPFLDAALKRNDADYDNTLLLSARSYDQIGQPEKVILAAQELLTKNVDSVSELKARSLLLKNFAKVKTDITQHTQKNSIQTLSQNTEGDSVMVLESLKWSMDFSCDQFCVEEISYLKEIQLQYLYIIEKDEVSTGRSGQMIKSRYEFFQSFLHKEHLDKNFRKKIAVGLLDSFKKLHDLQLTAATQGAVRAALFVRSLDTIEKNTESWLYQ
jgi:tetratricopeptide (TPR) repeat protein